MERINYDVLTSKENYLTHVYDTFLRNDTTVSILFDFTEFTYKEVRNVRGMDEQTLIGNIYLFMTCFK